MVNFKRNKTQTGAAMVEFAIVAGVFFIFLFGVIEFGRFLFTWNTLTEMARRGARIAAVCPPHHAAIARTAIYGDPAAGTTGVVLTGITTANITIQYFAGPSNSGTDHTAVLLNGSPGLVAYDDAFSQVGLDGTVRVSINPAGYNYNLIIPFLDLQPTPPTFSTELPAESLGVINIGGASITSCTYP